MDIKQKIGKRIAQLRILKGLTQEGLGYESEIHRTYIAAVETGKRNISVEALGKILNGLKMIECIFLWQFNQSIKIFFPVLHINFITKKLLK